MKILLTTDTYENQICGVSTSIATLKDELMNRGHDVRVLSLSKDNKSKIIENDYLIESYPLRLIDFRQPLKSNGEIMDEIISWGPDIVHIQTEWNVGRIGRKIAEKCNCPYINTAHTFWEDFTIGLIPISFIRSFFSKKLLKNCYKNSAALIVPSEKMSLHLQELSVGLPTHLIPTGVDIDKFNQDLSDMEKNKLKEELDLNDSLKILVYLGRVAKEKNLDELIDFLPDLVSSDERVRLLIVGEGPYLNHLKSRVKKSSLVDYVRFTGAVQPDEIYKYYKIGDIFVSPSTCETQGITYMEALASSLPLVCRYDEVLDGVIEEGYNGFTYATGHEYIHNVLKILDDDEFHSQLRSNAFKSSLRFSKDKFGEEIERIYSNVLGNEL